MELLSAPASSSSCGCCSWRWCFWWLVHFPEGLSCLQTLQCYTPKTLLGPTVQLWVHGPDIPTDFLPELEFSPPFCPSWIAAWCIP